jgi:hypothetical protein
LNCLLEASIERSRWSEQEGFVQLPAIPRDAEQALRKATPLDGRYRVACDQPSAEVLASWFEHMREIIERTRANYEDPARLASICTQAASIIRSTIPDIRRPVTPPTVQ